MDFNETVYEEQAMDVVPKKSGKITGTLVCLFLAILAFIALLVIENIVVNDIERTSVVVSVAAVPDNLYVTESNVSNYFAVRERVSDEVPQNALHSLELLMNTYITREIPQNAILTEGDSTPIDVYAGVENPVEVSILVGDLSQVVSGIIREGDYINLDILIPGTSLVKEQAEDTKGASSTLPSFSIDSIEGDVLSQESTDEDFWNITGTGVSQEDLTTVSELPATTHVCFSFDTPFRVSKVFTNSGERITADKEGVEGVVYSALLLNLIIPAEMEAEFNRALVDGIPRVSLATQADFAESSDLSYDKQNAPKDNKSDDSFADSEDITIGFSIGNEESSNGLENDTALDLTGSLTEGNE